MMKKKLYFLKTLSILFITLSLFENCSGNDEESTVNTINESNNSNIENNNSDNTSDGETNSNGSQDIGHFY